MPSLAESRQETAETKQRLSERQRQLEERQEEVGRLEQAAATLQSELEVARVAQSKLAETEGLLKEARVGFGVRGSGFGVRGCFAADKAAQGGAGWFRVWWFGVRGSGLGCSLV